MMTQTHGPSGAALWLTGDALTRVLGANHPYYLTLAGTLIALCAAKAPDIDNPDSAPAHALNRLIPGASEVIEEMLGHRGATHWASTGIALGVGTGLLASIVDPHWWIAGLALSVGWIAHIAGDCCTYQGAPAYGPFRRTMIRLPRGYRIRSGGHIEATRIRPATITWAWIALGISATLSILH